LVIFETGRVKLSSASEKENLQSPQEKIKVAFEAGKKEASPS
jgi:hypothetical protein